MVMKKYCFGVDVGGTTVKLGLFCTDGTILDKWEIRTRKEENGKHILSDVAEAIQKKMEEKGISKEEVEGVGLGTPGPVTEDGFVNKAVNLGWEEKFSLGDTLGALLGLPVKGGNDANVAALGEMWKGGGEGYKNVVLVTLGTGVGGGIIVNGRIITGANGAGGEIGHIHVENEETDACGCGNHGCLEQYASATGIVRLAKRALNSTEEPSVLRNREISAKAVFDALKSGDAVAEKVIKQFGKYLGNALAGIAAVVDPEVIVIGGGVSKAGDMLLDYVKEVYMESAFHGCRGVEFVLASLGNDAGIYGAAKLVL